MIRLDTYINEKFRLRDDTHLNDPDDCEVESEIDLNAFRDHEVSRDECDVAHFRKNIQKMLLKYDKTRDDGVTSMMTDDERRGVTKLCNMLSGYDRLYCFTDYMTWYGLTKLVLTHEIINRREGECTLTYMRAKDCMMVELYVRDGDFLFYYIAFND